MQDDLGSGRFPPRLMHAAATLYYLQDETQAHVATALGVSRATVSRLLAEARRQGIVRISVVDPTAGGADPDLSERAAVALGLERVYLAPEAHGSLLGAVLAPVVGRALADVGLRRDDVLLVSSGRTVWEVAQHELPQLPGVVVAPTIGGQDEPEAWYQTNEITRQWATRVSGRPAFLYAPAQPGPGLHAQLQDDPSTRRILDMWGRARCAVLGIGAPPSTRASMPGFVPRDADQLDHSAGDICTRFFDATGTELAYPGSDRLLATTYRRLREMPHTIGVAVGAQKIPSISAGARAGWFKVLVTDVATANGLVAARTE